MLSLVSFKRVLQMTSSPIIGKPTSTGSVHGKLLLQFRSWVEEFVQSVKNIGAVEIWNFSH